MKRPYIAMICVLVAAATGAFADKAAWYREPGTAVTFKASRFVITSRLPRGWSVSEEGLVPPPAFASACRVRQQFYASTEWNELLVSALDPRDPVRASRETRVLFKIGGHTAVSNRTVRDDRGTVDVYIDLSDLVPDNALVWTVEADRTEDGQLCEDQFRAAVISATIELDQAQ